MAVPFVTVPEMRAWEEASWAAGASSHSVIAEVGRQLAKLVRSLRPPGSRILLLLGHGNNGADARAAEPHLTGYQVERLEFLEPDQQLTALSSALNRRPDLVVDGWFGIGLNRSLSPDWTALIRTLNEANCFVVSVDVPSGLNADTGETWGAAVRADLTLTIGAPKLGLIRPSAIDVVGRLELASSVGLVGQPIASSDLRWVGPDDLGIKTRRPLNTHKGTFGHAVILAGSVGYSGAAVLAARAAGRTRPGLVSVLTTPEAWLPVSSQLVTAMVHPFAIRHPALANATAILAGPGLAASNLLPEMRQEVVRLWREFPGVMVADASALDWLRPGTPCVGPRVITPHPGEAGRLLGITAAEVQADRLGSLRRLAARHEATVILKGHQTLIGSSKGPVYLNPVGNPGLAQGGTGDVLAGYLTGLLAQPNGRRDVLATCLRAAWDHGRTADLMEVEDQGWTAEDLVHQLGSGDWGRWTRHWHLRDSSLDFQP